MEQEKDIHNEVVNEKKYKHQNIYKQYFFFLLLKNIWNSIFFSNQAELENDEKKGAKKRRYFHINGKNHMNFETGLSKEFHIPNAGRSLTMKQLQILYRIL